MTAGANLPIQFARFMAVGVLNTAIGLTFIFAAKALLGWGDLAANAFGYAIGLMASFVLNRTWTFRDRGRIGAAMLRFLGAFGLAYMANLATVFALRDFAALNSYLAQAAGVIPYTIVFFLISRVFVFLDPRPQRVEPPRGTVR
jgi:putative flippase GtrA